MKRKSFTLVVATPEGEEFPVYGSRIPRPTGRPLILHPGFTQSGDVYDLVPGTISLADYLWTHGYDVWIMHQRGTGGSKSRLLQCTLDDYATTDIPTIIEYVTRCTGKKPIFIGHSEGGVAAILSMLGVSKSRNGTTFLSDVQAGERQRALHGLVTLGSFPDMTGEATAWLRRIVNRGIKISILGVVHLRLSGETLLWIVNMLVFWPVPMFRQLRDAMFASKALRIIFFPFSWICILVGRFSLVRNLYVDTNVGEEARRALVYRTIFGTFCGIINQYILAVRRGGSFSDDGHIRYGDKYNRIALPMSVVTMEFCTFADPIETRRVFFDHLGSTRKTYVVWQGVGHEDHFMNPVFFPWVLTAVEAVS